MTFTKKTFALLRELRENNNKEWYHENKPSFQECVLNPFADMIVALSDRFEAQGFPMRGDKSSMFRMNRDVRFSKDKSPYKTNVSGMLTPSGTKSEASGFVYIQLSAAESFAAFGRYNLKAKALAPIRDRILSEPERFNAILSQLLNRRLDLDRSQSLSSMPRGYADYDDHPNADEIKLTNMMVRSDLTQTDWISGEAIDKIEANALASRDFIAFITSVSK